MISFAAYTAAETHSAFQWFEQPLKLPLPVGKNRDLHVIHGSLGPPQSAPKRHLDQFSRILQDSRT